MHQMPIMKLTKNVIGVNYAILKMKKTIGIVTKRISIQIKLI